MRRFTFLIALLLFHTVLFAQDRANITIDCSNEIGPMYPAWAYFGYDEPNYTYMPNGQKLLTEISELSKVPVYVRAHNLLTTGDGEARLKWGSTNAYTEDKKGNPVYNWTIVDRIMDTYVDRGMRPLVEMGFMPKALSSKPEPYEHNWNIDQPYNNIYTGWAYPPKDYEKWAELIYQWVKHSIDRYGQEEVETWLWEPWNEPNIKYWSGTDEEYLKLYDYSVDAVKRACPACIVGGPHSTGPGWDDAYQFMTFFLDHVLNGKNYVTGKVGSPLEFIAFHAKGRPEVVDDHVRTNMAPQLNDVSKGFEIISGIPETKDIPIIIGECDPEGCAACSEKANPQNGYRNGTMYSSYTASSFTKIYEMADAYGVNLQGILSWSFQFENQDWFDGFRSLATNGVDKPVLNVFRMFGMMDGQRVAVISDKGIPWKTVIDNGVRDQPDISAFACKDENNLTVMIWNYHDDDLPALAHDIALSLKGIPGEQVLVSHYRIDENFSNAYALWKSMGEPNDPSEKQYTELEQAGQLQLLTSPTWCATEEGILEVNFDLPRQAVSLLKLEW